MYVYSMNFIKKTRYEKLRTLYFHHPDESGFPKGRDSYSCSPKGTDSYAWNTAMQNIPGINHKNIKMKAGKTYWENAHIFSLDTSVAASEEDKPLCIT